MNCSGARKLKTGMHKCTCGLDLAEFSPNALLISTEIC
uniref:Uncharacterized protein n=1 Tax=Arundo donax TaxID=35708 RepID=A0A0A9GVQ8_ARUDO